MDPGGGGELAVFTANIFTACSSGGKQGASAANAGAAEAQQEGGHGSLRAPATESCGKARHF